MVNLKKYKKYRVTDVATIERAKKGKIYPGGETLIGLSGTKGNVIFHEKPGEVSSRYGVITPTDKYLPYYFFLCMERAFPEFIAKNLTTFNLQIETLSNYYVELHEEKESQQYVLDAMAICDESIENQQKIIDELKEMKKGGLQNMLI